MTGNEPLLRVARVDKSYPTAQGPLRVLRDVSLELAAGGTLALTGECGSGKSTLLHLSAGLDRRRRGRDPARGADVAALGDAGRAALRREAIGLVFQQFNLIPSLDVAANLAFQARLAGRLDAGWQRRDWRSGWGSEPCSTATRAAVGRPAAARGDRPGAGGRPQLILADEPTGNLDEATGDAVMDADAGAGARERGRAADGHAFGAARRRGWTRARCCTPRAARLMWRQRLSPRSLSHWRRHPVQAGDAAARAGAGDRAVVGGAGDQRRGARRAMPAPPPCSAQDRLAPVVGRSAAQRFAGRRLSWRCAGPAGWSRRCSRATARSAARRCACSASTR